MTTEQTIYNTAARDGMPPKLASLIVYQSKHETGGYKHRFFTVGNNAFGYSYNSGSKWQLDKGGPLADNGVSIAQYVRVEDSVHEMTDWIKRRQVQGKFPRDLSTITDENQYAGLLKSAGYYQDSVQNYASGIARYLNSQVQNFVASVKKSPWLFVGAIVLIGAGIFAYAKLKKAA